MNVLQYCPNQIFIIFLIKMQSKIHENETLLKQIHILNIKMFIVVMIHLK